MIKLVVIITAILTGQQATAKYKTPFETMKACLEHAPEEIPVVEEYMTITYQVVKDRDYTIQFECKPIDTDEDEDEDEDERRS